MQLPALIVKAQFPRRNIDEMRRVADNQVPLFGCWNTVEIVRVIDRNPIFESVLRHGAAASLDRFRVDIGDAQCVTKPVAEESEADEPWTRTPLEHAPLTRHTEIVKQRQVVHAGCPTSAIENDRGTDSNLAVTDIPPWLQSPQARLHDASFESFQESQQGVSSVNCANIPEIAPSGKCGTNR